jgi:hypothetical protein
MLVMQPWITRVQKQCICRSYSVQELSTASQGFVTTNNVVLGIAILWLEK